MTYHEQKACANCKHAERSGAELYLWLCTKSERAPVYGHAICERYEEREGERPSPVVYSSPAAFERFLRVLGYREEDFQAVVYPPTPPHSASGEATQE